VIDWRFTTTVSDSRIHGKGRFATEDIPRGSIVLVIDGDIYRNGNGSFVNHSKDNNLDYVGNNTWVSNKRISAGEEMTMDYLQWLKELPF
jgi:hypothetical protein